MTDIAVAEQATKLIGPGRLVLVVGPSGAGKDTLINAARSLCVDDPAIVFARRVVTREASAAEDNLQVAPDQFSRLEAAGDFALHWRAHGHAYGLPLSLDDDIRVGRTVVANVSRMVIEPARSAYADVVVVLITAPAEVLAARIAARARASDGSIADRVGRSVDATPNFTISNVGDPIAHARDLLEMIRHGRPQP
ncbi:ribose 1,5-bisphosphokinase [Rhodopseudomonas thermotolerans]|uniref:Ribose 1,5-bisphosphate phosphokinase PhnN n=2 Tax=Rhodopseudomonas TaxID=1073 RepID=A0A336JK41_9BRAD|nr:MULTISPECIES: phosphonate metabolism protein/1,5-bisphosphokinase (PRPP-forming) PhnN [Rhodopseudomonas]RED38379.1 ribose 1,5-bisphosphokinase [Rhodopseudomonas pentothenatexigens]REG05964.1 ribose 1,5-bisphosphokinase [Rhodopseudomonas thermotolerans]SSW89832.1 ribose 1,5-bisphosphokinase [Rhodopseudomonas pentothenatexigens]